jgi:predicted SAM-dependent methyltransferase
LALRKSIIERLSAPPVGHGQLEHEARPLDVLKECCRVLKPGGFIVVKVPNYATINRVVMARKWCGFRYPDHLNYFTPASLRNMAAAAAFTTHFRWLERMPSDDNMWGTLIKPTI